MDTMKGVRQHKAMATDGAMASGDFGVKKFDCYDGMNMNSESMASRGAMGDGSRGADKPVRHTKGKMPAQANPDHGPHR